MNVSILILAREKHQYLIFHYVPTCGLSKTKNRSITWQTDQKNRNIKRKSNRITNFFSMMMFSLGRCSGGTEGVSAVVAIVSTDFDSIDF